MGKHKKSGSGAGDDLEKQEEPPLQAVLLADSFARTFRPISLDFSKVLCPLNNVVMLDYALEFLALSGVHQVFCVCTADDVEEHLTQYKPMGDMVVTCIKDSSLTNAGDALRELDKRNLVQSNPFLLMHGDVVMGVDLTAVIEEHKQRHKKDTSAIMTLVFMKVGEQNKLQPPASDLFVGFDPQDQRILEYNDHASNGDVPIPCSFLASHSTVEMHDDLLDCGLDICSPQVLARFSDEFDYRDIRREFVTNTVAEEEEGLQQKLYGHVLEEGDYAVRVQDLAVYHAVSRDLLDRWVYPVAPTALPSGYERKYRYTGQQHYLYKEQLSPGKYGNSSQIAGPGMVGSNSIVGDDCDIEGTVIGNNCVIGNGVTMKDCHVWQNVIIEQGATVLESILADDVVIKKGATVSRGCVVGSGCVIGTGVLLPEFTRITKSLDTDGEGDDFGDFDSSVDEEEDESSEEESHPDKVPASDHNVVGPDGVGRVWQPTVADEDEYDDDELEQDPLELFEAQSIGYDRSKLYKERATLQQEREDGFSDQDSAERYSMDEDDFVSEFDRGLTIGADSFHDLDQRGPDLDRVKELKAICLDFEHTGTWENLNIEINSFKFSQNASFTECTMGATLAMIEQVGIEPNMNDARLVPAFKKHLQWWAPLLEKMSRNNLEAERGIVVALEMAATAEGPVGERLSRDPSFALMLKILDDEEVVNEDAMLSWAAERKTESDDTARGKLFQQQSTQNFVEWLETAESDDDDSEEESEEEESD